MFPTDERSSIPVRRFDIGAGGVRGINDMGDIKDGDLGLNNGKSDRLGLEASDPEDNPLGINWGVRGINEGVVKTFLESFRLFDKLGERVIGIIIGPLIEPNDVFLGETIGEFEGLFDKFSRFSWE